MVRLKHRIEALEGDKRDYLTLSEVLDRMSLPVDDGRRAHPDLVAALDSLPVPPV